MISKKKKKGKNRSNINIKMKIIHGLQKSLRIYGCGRFNLEYLGSLFYRNVIVFLDNSHI
jgi:hypothetical protein